MSVSIEISSVSSRKELSDFIKLPWRIYKGDPAWVPPLLMDMKKILNQSKNPFFEHSEAELFLARHNGQPVGRIAAILNNNHNKAHQEKIGFFGFFESINDQGVVNQLFERAATWAKDRGLTHLRGPTNFSTNDTCGFLIEGFDASPVILMNYNPRYYLDLVTGCGFTEAKKLNAYYFDRDMSIPERFGKMAKRTLEDETINFRTVRLKNFREEVETVKKIYNEAWQSNWGFVPLTDKEIEHLAKELRPVVDPDIVFFAEVNGESAGFSLSLPDYNQILKKVNGRLFPFGIFVLLLNKKKITRIRVITLGVLPKFQRKRGLAPTFYYETYHRGKKKGYSLAEFSWILEDNVLMNRALEGLGAKLYKQYAIYEKAL